LIESLEAATETRRGDEPADSRIARASARSAAVLCDSPRLDLEEIIGNRRIKTCLV
jgi:hypothetical protein